ncbi:DUF4368 domain-containing protein [Bacillus sp. CECT 9360]|uniref:DUF4368 domain-containing protein n=1 Tax=Bacillus sp. CECT 9360 TaxID=2845821 RepID=UPI001E2AE61C|nr:DUF4368 domain-containing protein [Bacillus sp. CECT 9360]CAH0346747.1 hypothetical protein BCI9360_03093 [Bacillus sp. CECT 9360]
MVQDKFQRLELEKAEIKKSTAEKQAVIKISAILDQLKDFFKFKTLTSEMLFSFVEKIEVNETKDIKIYYKFAQIEGL